MVVPECKVRVLSDKKYIEPVCDKLKIDKCTVHFWYKEVHTVVLRELETIIFDRKTLTVDYFKSKIVELVIGGDKGQAKFRVLIKLLIRDKETREVLHSYVKKVGHIDAEKDNYETIVKTIRPSLNESLGVLKYKKLCFTNDKVYFSESSAGALFSQQVKLIGTGDLEFYFTILGRVNMSSNWCFWCLRKIMDWKKK